MKRIALMIGAAMMLAGCGDVGPAVQANQPFHIAKVEAWGPPPEGSNDAQLRDLRDQTQLLAARVPQSQNPRLLRLHITRFHKKNPGISLLIGDSTNMSVTGEVVSLDGKSVMGTFTADVMDDAYVNGVIGMVAAATTTTDEAARRLDNKAADAILEKIYGSRVWRSWSGRR